MDEAVSLKMFKPLSSHEKSMTMIFVLSLLQKQSTKNKKEK